jgi:hypothetical protein
LSHTAPLNFPPDLRAHAHARAAETAPTPRNDPALQSRAAVHASSPGARDRRPLLCCCVVALLLCRFVFARAGEPIVAYDASAPFSADMRVDPRLRGDARAFEVAVPPAQPTARSGLGLGRSAGRARGTSAAGSAWGAAQAVFGEHAQRSAHAAWCPRIPFCGACARTPRFVAESVAHRIVPVGLEPLVP